MLQTIKNDNYIVDVYQLSQHILLNCTGCYLVHVYKGMI